LEPDESGVFVVTIILDEFINASEHNFEFFITYTVDENSSESDLIMNAGELSIDANKIYSTELDVVEWTYDKYKNLLAITSTSEFYKISIQFKEPLHVSKGIENFLVKSLKFEVLKVNSDRDKEQPEVKKLTCIYNINKYFFFFSYSHT
jgi:hypothetical protein